MQSDFIQLQQRLQNRHLDFSAAYLALQELHSLIKNEPELINEETVKCLKQVFENDTHVKKQRQAFFLYYEAAQAVTSIMASAAKNALRQNAFSVSKEILFSYEDCRHMAVARALGEIPLSLNPVWPDDRQVNEPPPVSVGELLRAAGMRRCTANRAGRSLIFENSSEKILVVKVIRKQDDIRSVMNEALWMEFLNSGDIAIPDFFHVPSPLNINGEYILTLDKIPSGIADDSLPSENANVIAYIADKSYFHYPNEPADEGLPTENSFRRIMIKNAWLLGFMTGRGIVHTAPIPLFHNRVQKERRDDMGLYQWPKAGRLDRWLASCRYPNFGVSGLRDFEHLKPFTGNGKDLYEHIGAHILSLILVTGSWFRNKETHSDSLNSENKFKDTRHLFDKGFFIAVVQGMFDSYYKGFTGLDSDAALDVDYTVLIERMICEMGVDRYMEEILRVQDQTEMTAEEFIGFLKDRGLSDEEIVKHEKGNADITLKTGPHLGGFNRKISLPELIRYIATASAVCISGRYIAENGLA